MQLLMLSIDPHKYLKIELPDIGQKQNLYYEPSDKLNQFDIVKIFFVNNDQSLLLFEDVLQEGLCTFTNCLKRLISNNNVIVGIQQGQLGKLYNIDIHKELYEIPPEYMVWSYKHTLTFIYRIGHVIYLEIAPSYPWHSSDPKKDECFISFDEFMKTYKPYALIEISLAIAEKWIVECEALIQQMK